MMGSIYDKLVPVPVKHILQLNHHFIFCFTFTVGSLTRTILSLQPPLAVNNYHYHIFGKWYLYRSGTTAGGRKQQVWKLPLLHIIFFIPQLIQSARTALHPIMITGYDDTFCAFTAKQVYLQIEDFFLSLITGRT